MSEKQKYIDFEAYERVAEPHKRERVFGLAYCNRTSRRRWASCV